MNNIKLCNICDAEASFEREWIEQPQEGEVCRVCCFWICADCVDWSKTDPDPICKECSEKESMMVDVEGDKQ